LDCEGKEEEEVKLEQGDVNLGMKLEAPIDNGSDKIPDN
jgi:hypothetical protein